MNILSKVDISDLNLKNRDINSETLVSTGSTITFEHANDNISVKPLDDESTIGIGSSITY